MERQSVPIIDWELGTKLAGNNRELAEEMISLLTKNLLDEYSLIMHYHAEENYKELQRQVHRLHGAVCYCGLPRLKTVLSKLETNLKSNIMDNLSSLLTQLNVEITLLLESQSASSQG